MQRGLTTLEPMTRTLGLENLTAKIIGQIEPQIFLKKDSLAFGERFELWHSFCFAWDRDFTFGFGLFLAIGKQPEQFVDKAQKYARHTISCWMF